MKLRKQSKQLSSKPPGQPTRKSVPRASPKDRDPPISVHKRSPEVDQTVAICGFVDSLDFPLFHHRRYSLYVLVLLCSFDKSFSYKTRNNNNF